jgi:hypothetical protein
VPRTVSIDYETPPSSGGVFACAWPLTLDRTIADSSFGGRPTFPGPMRPFPGLECVFFTRAVMESRRIGMLSALRPISGDPAYATRANPYLNLFESPQPKPSFFYRGLVRIAGKGAGAQDVSGAIQFINPIFSHAHPLSRGAEDRLLAHDGVRSFLEGPIRREFMPRLCMVTSFANALI